MAYGYEQFKSAVFGLTRIDLNAYKEQQMKRRIDALIAKHGIKGYENYMQVLKTDRTKFEEFVNYLTINVSEFYRDTDQWQIMERTVIPELMDKFGKSLRIWSAACSTGDEPYSLVMALSRYIPLYMIHVVATDLDKQVIAKARTGLYSEKSIAAVPADLKKKYFTKVGLSYQISNDIKSKVEFREHNLLSNDYQRGYYHMIVCRNVLIYFTEEAKDTVFRKFYQSLVPGGMLFIGNSEQILNYREIGYTRKNSYYYERPMI